MTQKGITQDVSNLGDWGDGDYEIVSKNNSWIMSIP